jgi:hypothetical protein
MSAKPSESRYDGGGQVKYLVYRSPQAARDGGVQVRTRVKRLYFPTDARSIKVDPPTTLEKRTGRSVHGVQVHYEYQLAGARARRGDTKYELPERWADRTKVVELPEGAKSVKLTSDPPEGPKMAVT